MSASTVVADRRARELIEGLRLEPHPEGGYFREVFRSDLSVEPADGRGPRAALTAIYFLLVAGAVSRWHRVRSDEAWHHYEGGPLELLTLSPDARELIRTRLGRRTEGLESVHCVPSGRWQAAHTLGAYTLVGCTVGPGFDFADFEMLADLPELAGRIRAERPDAARFI